MGGKNENWLSRTILIIIEIKGYANKKKDVSIHILLEQI